MSPDSAHETALRDGVFEEIDGRTFMRFERRLAHPVERVWSALTDPAQLAQWFCGTSAVQLELVEGGAFAIRVVGPPELVELAGADAETRWTVRRVEPPRLFEHSFLDEEDSYARYELEPDGDGCRLVVTVAVPSRKVALEGQFLVGMHMTLDALEQVLDGVPAPWTRERFDELAAHYSDR